jgi:hypothetical protein
LREIGILGAIRFKNEFAIRLPARRTAAICRFVARAGERTNSDDSATAIQATRRATLPVR